jgi:hypothetical protein
MLGFSRRQAEKVIAAPEVYESDEKSTIAMLNRAFQIDKRHFRAGYRIILTYKRYLSV